EDDAQLQAEVANRIEHGMFVRVPSGYDTAPGQERLDASLPKPLHEPFRRRLCQQTFLLCGREVQQRAVLGDDDIEQVEAWEQRFELRNDPTSDEHELPAGFPETLQRRDRLGVHAPVMGDGAVVVGAEREVTHELALIDQLSRPNVTVPVAVPPRTCRAIERSS